MYWSERQGRGPRATPLEISQLRRVVFSIIDELIGRDYFQQVFGYECVDAGFVSGLAGKDVQAWFLRTLHRDNIWPYRNHEGNYDPDTLFDVL
jgi:hypothetical protein